MPRLIIRRFKLALSALALGIATFYVRRLVFVIFPISRVIQPIEDFPFTCQRVQHPLVEGCEHIWLDHGGRKLYAACASVESRRGWSPAGNSFNLSARSRTDHIAVLDIDNPGSDGLYGLRELEIRGDYPGDLDVHGFDARRVGNSLRFWLINHRPPIDHITGESLDAYKLGSNDTIEIFDFHPASDKLEYVKTIVSDAIITANGLAVDADGLGFAVTNDHHAKVGVAKGFELLLGGGSIAYCQTDSGECKIVTEKNCCNMPNGIVNTGEGTFLVSQSASGVVTKYHRRENQMHAVQESSLGYALDNLSLDEQGDIFAAAFPDLRALSRLAGDPSLVSAPATVFKIPQTSVNDRGSDSLAVKVIEDRDAQVLPMTTGAIHDSRTGRLFLVGLFSPFLGVCESHS